MFFTLKPILQSAMSAGRVIKLIDDISPPKIERIKVTEINGGMGMYTLR